MFKLLASRDLGDPPGIHAKPRSNIMLPVASFQHSFDKCCVIFVQGYPAGRSTISHCAPPSNRCGLTLEKLGLKRINNQIVRAFVLADFLWVEPESIKDDTVFPDD